MVVDDVMLEEAECNCDDWGMMTMMVVVDDGQEATGRRS